MTKQWKVTKASLEARIAELEELRDYKKDEARTKEEQFDALVQRYAQIAITVRILREQCSRAERQVVRLLDRLEAGTDSPEAGG